MTTRSDLERLSQELTDKGLLIEAGFAGLRSAVIGQNAPDTQLREMRMAFFAGAQHLFASILSILEPGAEPTEKDLQRMDAINHELMKFSQEFQLQHLPTKGNS